MKDFYYILGVGAKATSVEISEAYQKLSEKFRPDANQHDSYFESRYKEICEAYQVLSDPVRRITYDQELRKAEFHTSGEKDRIRKYYSRPKGLNLFLTLILVALTAVFGHYVYNVIHKAGAKKIAQVQDSTATVVLPHKIKHHKHRHFAKNKHWSAPPSQPATVINKPVMASVTPVAVPVKVKTAIAPPQATKPTMVSAKNVTSSNPSKPSNLASSSSGYNSEPHQPENSYAGNNNITNRNAATYTVYIRANETGRVNLRKYDYFNSEVIDEIPDGAKVMVLEKGRFYCKIMFNNAIGFVPKWTVADR